MSTCTYCGLPTTSADAYNHRHQPGKTAHVACLDDFVANTRGMFAIQQETSKWDLDAFHTATITKVVEWDAIALVERTRWRIDPPASSRSGRKLTRTRREAIEWCVDMGFSWVVVK